MNDTNNGNQDPMDLARDIELQESMKSIGLGDSVAKFIKAATLGKVKPCGKCQKRTPAGNASGEHQWVMPVWNASLDRPKADAFFQGSLRPYLPTSFNSYGK